MPKPDQWITNVMKLYQRCKERNALPVGGGVLDQPLDIMEAFDVVDEVVARHKRKAQHGTDRDGAIAQARGALNVGR